VRFAFIDAQKANFPITTLCRALQLSESGYHAWNNRPESLRSQKDRLLQVHIKAAFSASRETYGSPRLTNEIRENGVSAGRHRIARLMKEAGIQAKKPRRFKVTTDSKHSSPIAPNLVERKFDKIAVAPNLLWVTDITYIWTWQGWLFLCVFIDVYSRKVVGWSIDETMEARMVLDALNMALVLRNPGRGLIGHSDRGSQYASEVYRARTEKNGMLASMSRKGDCWDNAIAESFFASLKGDLIYRRSWGTKASVEAAVKEWIEVFYNCERRHSSLGNVSPVNYEHLTREAQAA